MEEEWLVETDLQKMLFLLGHERDRRLRVFACGCCRRVWHLLSDGRSRRAVEVAERYADAQADDEDLRLAIISSANIAEVFVSHSTMPAEEARSSAAFAALSVTYSGAKAADYASSSAVSAIFHAATAASAPSAAAVRDAERARQICLLRDIFSYLLRPIVISPRWRRWNNAAVTHLAQAAYDERILPTGTLDNTRLAILADALEEAGCTDEQILSHLRSGGEHYRGCWVIDLLLGKE